MNIIKLLIPNFMATLLATAGGVKKTIQTNREQTENKQRKSIQRPLLQCSNVTQGGSVVMMK